MKNPEVFTGGRNARQDVRNNKLKNQFVKRSNVMKYNRFIKIAATIFVALTIVVSGAFAQDAVLSGTSVANAGTIKIKGALSGTIKTLGGTVEFNSVAAGGQAIPTGYTFTNLKATGGTGDKTLGAATTVSGVLTVDNGAKSLLLGNGTLNLTGATPITLTAGSIDFTLGTVNYNGDADQTVYGITYKNLGTSSASAHVKTAGANVDVTGTLTNSSTLNFSTYTLNAHTGATFSNSGTLKSSGTVTIVDASSVIGGTFEYAATQTVAPASYTNLTFVGGVAKTFTSGSTYSIAGTYTPDVGANDYTGSTINYNGAGPLQAIADVSYANLTFSNGTKAWTLGADRTITGTLTLNAGGGTKVTGAHNLNVSGSVIVNDTLNVTAATAVVFADNTSTVSGSSDIIGSVTRTHTFTPATAYTYNNSATTVALSAPVASETFTMTSTPNTYPTTGSHAGNTVKRKYVPSYALFSGTADVKLGYLKAEASDLSVTEAKLKDFESVVSSGSKLSGTYGHVPSGGADIFGSVSLAAITPLKMVSGQELALDDRFNQFTTIASTEWSIGTTWSEGSAPTATDDAIINTTGVTLDAIGHVNNLVIASGMGLTLGTATSALQVDGGLTNNGGLTLVGSSTLLVNGTFNNLGSATLTNAGTITVQ
jgi:hypothetical protein